MNVEIVKNPKLEKDKVILHCYNVDNKIQKVKDYIERMDSKIIAKNENNSYFIELDDIYYIESIDKKTFIYLKNKVLECNLKLYEIENQFEGLSLFRGTKSSIINLKYVQKVSIMINRNLLITLENNEKVIISRRNVKDFNRIIGME